MSGLTKWEYITLISRRGSHYGTNGGVLDLLKWCEKPNTASVTLEEAKTFYEMQVKAEQAESGESATSGALE